MRVLCAEPLKFRPWEVGRLTPFQVRQVLLVERDKKGLVILDPPAGDEPAELTLEGEWRTHFRKLGVTDPDALRRLIERAIDGELAEPAGGIDDGGE